MFYINYYQNAKSEASSTAVLLAMLLVATDMRKPSSSEAGAMRGTEMPFQ